jgi:DNA-binding NtrC family response regulator
MGLVLWIDQNVFATGLLEKVFKKRDLPFYTIQSAEDFLYLVDDLRPEVIVLDFKTASENLKEFQAQYESSENLKKLPFVLIDGDLNFIQKIAGRINRPFDPFLIPSKIQELLTPN